MKWQLWRLQDLRDGGGLGLVVELFFLFIVIFVESNSFRSYLAR
jgi:hypothetical protein